MKPVSCVQQTSTHLPASADNLVKLWLYRAMVSLEGRSGMIGGLGWEDWRVAIYLGVTDCIDGEGEPDPVALTSKLQGQLAHFEKPSVRKALPPILAANIERLGGLLHLSPTGRKLLAFMIMLDNVRLLELGAARLDKLSTTNLYRALAVILSLPEAAVRRELRHDGPLIRSGVVMVKRGDRCELADKVKTLSADFAERMMVERGGEVTAFQDLFFRSRAATLTRKNFQHVDRQFEILLALLRGNTKKPSTGINVLVYGTPGVGKTEFARLLADEAGMMLHEVASAGCDGEPLAGGFRLRAYWAAVSLLARGRNLLMFDEAEDIFGRGEEPFAPVSIAQSRKAWMSRALEENRVPTIWLTNAIEGIDPAFVRRFSVVLEMPAPGRTRMRTLVREVAGDLLKPAALGRLAEVPDLAPAVVTRAAQVVRAVRQDIGDDQTEDAMRLLIDGTLVAQGHKGISTLAANDACGVYSTRFIAADADLVKIAEGLRNTRRGRLCLYGPPGTGKTAFGHWLAEEIGAPLHVKRTSDILSPYVGRSEQKLARAFSEAAAERAVLLLDEVDSFLQDRKGARHSWEVTQVNEMLTQMEAFEGVFIASTNLMDGLDPASIRRFDLKLKFGFMRKEQSAALLVEYCRALKLGEVGAENTATVESIHNLTPGDFASVARRHGFSSFGNVAEFVKALLAEARMKREGRVQAIGFIASA